MYFKRAPQRDNRVKVSAILRAGHKVSEVAHLVGYLTQPSTQSEKRMDDGEGVNRPAGSGRKTVVDCDRLGDAIRGTDCGMPFEISS